MPIKLGKSHAALASNIKEMMKAGHPKKQAIAAALSMKRKAIKMAEGGEVSGTGGADTSTTGNKTKTGGSNPGGASTGGAGTVTINTGKIPPKGINISNVGGKTDSRNAGGMDPSDEDDEMMSGGGMAEGGMVGDEDYLDSEHERSLYQLMEQGDQPPVANPHVEDLQKKLAMALHKASENAEYMAMGGLVEGMDGDEEPLVPHNSTEEPMSEEDGDIAELEHSVIEGVPKLSPSGLSEEAKKAIEAKKKLRRYSR